MLLLNTCLINCTTAFISIYNLTVDDNHNIFVIISLYDLLYQKNKAFSKKYQNFLHSILQFFKNLLYFVIFKGAPSNQAEPDKSRLHKLAELVSYFPDDEDSTRWYRCQHYFHLEYQLLENLQSSASFLY